MNRLHAKLLKIGNDPKATAKTVGLRYLSDRAKGFTRYRAGDGFKYRDPEGKIVRDKQLLQRFAKLVIPPAWENVWISPVEHGHLQVTGTDTKGRKQYRYHPEWNDIRNQSKFFRLRRFADALPKIRSRVEKDLALPGLPYEKVLALVVKLIETTNIRIGNDAYKKLYGSFGLTTLRDRHVKFDRATVWFEFTGKKGVKHKIALQSARLAKLVQRCKDIPGQDLFQYYDDDGTHRCIGSGDVNAYIKEISGEDFSAKDFRCWSGSVQALCAFQDIGAFKSDTECKKKIVAVVDFVAEKLGNTRSVCKKYYVHPAVIASYENRNIGRYACQTCDDSVSLNGNEKALVALLDEAIDN
ncbi:DNA topoisomerase [Flavobacterium longum]|uniref:DNA topoisomerase IB n=1 Tax=Flavobacterium longum TaxID=1299340 RepID=UPI0039E9AABF